MLAFKWTPWWGTAPEWLAAVGTLLAFAVALRLLFKELDTRREALDDRLRSQARLVVAWTSHNPGSGELALSRLWYIRIKNGSDEPVRNVTVTLYVKRPSQHPPLEPLHRRKYKVLAPQTLMTTERLPVDESTFDGPPVSIVFRDSQGYMWKRNPDGILELLARPPAVAKRRSAKDRLDAFAKGEMDALE